jgi:hypothetical protein
VFKRGFKESRLMLKRPTLGTLATLEYCSLVKFSTFRFNIEEYTYGRIGLKQTFGSHHASGFCLQAVSFAVNQFLIDSTRKTN